MHSRIMIYFIIVTHLMLISQCRTTKHEAVTKEDLTSFTEGKIIDVVMKDGTLVRFDKRGGRYVEHIVENKLYRAIVGVTLDGKAMEIDPDMILEAYIERSEASGAGTVAIIAIAIPIVIVGFVAASIGPRTSCPYIYSFDGQRYIFDAQSYAGAITPGLKRADYSRLDHLRAVNGTYTIMMRNDPINETQYTDEASLLVVDHDPATGVVFGYDGTPYAFTNSIPPSSVVDENGNDIAQFFKSRDQVAWQTQLPTDTSYRTLDFRHHLTFTFPKPADIHTAKLFFNGGTAYWGSTMVELLLSLHGDNAETWLQGIDRGGPEVKELFQFMEGQELYHLKVNVLEDTTWKTRGIIKSGGGIAIEDRLIELDLHNVSGDSLKIRIDPPLGFWKFDYFSVIYDNVTKPEIRSVSASVAEDQQGKDIKELLRATDNEYQVMNETGNFVKLSFHVPLQPEGAKRSLFLKTSGYYKIHLQKGMPNQMERVAQMLNNPKLTVQFAMDEYLKWRSLLSISK